MDGTILIADDDRTIRTVLTQAFTRAGCKVHATASLTTLSRWVSEGLGDLVISDVIMPDGNGLDALPKIAGVRPELPVIIISAQNTIMTAIKAEQAEAFDYLPKPFDLPDLMKRAASALGQKVIHTANPSRQTSKNTLPLVGQTPVMQDLYRVVAQVMNTELPVLVKGDSGTGKSLIATTIHDFSDRHNLPLLVLSSSDLENCSDISAELAKAKGGSVVLDEIGDLPMSEQAHMVRALDRLGETAPRILATSQRNLLERIESGDFRTDLYYRLSAVTIGVPTLPERLNDVPALIKHFLDLSQSEKSFSVDAVELMKRYHWPGNIRQLKNTVDLLCATVAADEIAANDVLAQFGPATETQATTQNLGGARLAASIAQHLERYFDLHRGALPPDGLYGRILKEMEVPLLEIALGATGGNQAKCADLLGINRNTLRKKLTEHDIRVTRHRKLM